MYKTCGCVCQAWLEVQKDVAVLNAMLEDEAARQEELDHDEYARSVEMDRRAARQEL